MLHSLREKISITYRAQEVHQLRHIFINTISQSMITNTSIQTLNGKMNMNGLSVNEDSHSTRNAIHLMIRNGNLIRKKKSLFSSFFLMPSSHNQRKRFNFLFFLYADSQTPPRKCHFSFSSSFQLWPTPSSFFFTCFYRLKVSLPSRGLHVWMVIVGWQLLGR